ncbi:MAG: hypothetical protein IJY97_08180 [Clostridia bacterium]|nr:hypothetical protein [Clostridia bacterium]
MIKLFKVCGFSRQSLEPTSAEVGILSVLQAGAVLGTRLEGVNSPLMGDFCSFTPRAHSRAE